MSAETENGADKADATFFWAVRPWATKNFAAVGEGNVFSILFPLEYVIRSFEFAPVDGAMCLDAPAYAPQSTYAERLFSTHHRNLERPRRFVQFDIKSTTALEAGTQHTVTGLRQHARTAFYLVLCASDPAFISLIPNVPATRRSRTDKHHFSVSSTRSLPVQGAAYGYLDPEHAAHRMPIGLLATAMQRVRDCALASTNKRDYVNPWTGLAYGGWEPAITESLDDMWPQEDTKHYQACLGTLTLWRELWLAREDGEEEDDVRFDMVALQPRLADMKILFKGRQWLVQCKSDPRPRRPGHLGNVPIARTSRGGSNGEAQCSLHHYFASHDRFDFLLYDLRFDDRENPPVVGFFFLPERVLPDAFFATCDAAEASFDRADFLPYYMTVGENGDWGRHILDVIEANPEPRRAARPFRDCVLQRPLTRKIVARLERLQRPQGALEPTEPRVSNPVVSRRRLFAGVMDQCAKRLSGLLVVFAHNHAACDFGFAPYAWTVAERETYRATGRPPAAVHDLPAAMPIVPMYLFPRDMGCDWRGPMLSGAEFRRVNSWDPPRLLLFDAIAATDVTFPGPLFVVPTTDLSFTARHQQEYTRHVEVDQKKGNRHRRVPLIRELLHSGRNIADYVLPRNGPAMYEGSDDGWAELWTLLTKFTGTATFSHPSACPRIPADYRTTLQQLHARWWEEASRRAQDGVSLPSPPVSDDVESTSPNYPSAR